ncbi:hypothetical protein Y1Q_0016291 [Alligator mississippiensis]|uniref:Uncharacterized protein n=1 Tax=Alligator mississippiensis TaxID=8496 RepID=A0A151NS86_ALLMI|nr:hypothetical protein Y1Q_0016291 [Alligator mississippiensis]
MPTAPPRVDPRVFTPYKDGEDPEVFLSNLLSNNQYAVVINAYTPVLNDEEVNKEQFYCALDTVLTATAKEDKLILMGANHSLGFSLNMSGTQNEPSRRLHQERKEDTLLYNNAGGRPRRCRGREVPSRIRIPACWMLQRPKGKESPCPEESAVPR